MAGKKKRKTNSGGSVSGTASTLLFDSLSSRSSSTSTASSAADMARSSNISNGSHSSSRSSDGEAHAEADADDAGEELDVMGTPAALAPATVARHHLHFTPSAVPRHDAPCTPGGSSGEDTSMFRKLHFNMKECATPGRYDARHKLGQPLAVYCRIKPLTEAEKGEVNPNVVCPVQVESETSILCTAPPDSGAGARNDSTASFTFTRTFGPDATQEEVYIHTAKPLVDSFVAGQNGLIFAYGITASGKTYTMQGAAGQPGLIPRIVLDLFNLVTGGAAAAEAVALAQARATALTAGEPAPESVVGPLKAGESFTVTASYLEVYNEQINDLLSEPTKSNSGKAVGQGAATGGRTTRATKNTRGAASSAAAEAPQCRLVQNGDEMCVIGLREVEINTHREALSLLEQGQSHRAIHETSLNADSSRSHSVFTLKLLLPGGGTWARLSVVDLAGSERTRRVAHDANGSRQKETVSINRSLLVLGNCLKELKYNQQHPRRQHVVPFRESLITMLFKDSLTGWGRTVMLAAASQRASDYDETIHALTYAAAAKEVRAIMSRVENKRTAAEIQAQAATVAAGKQKRAEAAAALTSGTHSGTNSARPSAGKKRHASQPLLDLDELEQASAAVAAGRSSWGADDSANPSYDSLLDTCFQLRQRIVELELAAARTEENVRLELTAQHEEAIAELEEQCQQRVDEAYAKAEEKSRKMRAIWMAEAEQARMEGKENAIAPFIASISTAKVRALATRT